MTRIEMIIYFLLSILLSISFYIRHRNSRLRRLGLPPGNLGIPFIGETLKLISAYKTENPEPFLDERVKRFGPLFVTHVFGEQTVFSVDPEANRFILQNEGKLFESSYPKSICDLLGKHSLLVMKGNLHRKLHALTMSFANSPIIRDHLLGDIDRLVRLNLDSWSDRVYLMEEAKKITFELSMKQLMSLDPCAWTEAVMKEYVLLVEGFFTVPLFFSNTYRKAMNARNKVAEELGKVVRKRREERKSGERKNDLLEALLDSDDGEGGDISDDQVVDFLVALLVAGYETTSTIMTLAVKFLSDTPLALAQLKNEHEQIRMKKGDSEALDWSDYKSMAFTQCVCNETLRVANTIAGIFRRTTTDVHLGGYTIPKGWKIFASFRGIHLDHEHFKDARTFNPWRWQNISGVTSTGIGNVFTPFGGGPRLCPGYELARVELSVFLHHLVTRFGWSPAEEDKLVFFPTTRMQKHYPINVKRRNRF